MKQFLLICVLLIAVVNSCIFSKFSETEPDFHGEEYQSKSAEEKWNEMDEEILSHQGCGKFFGPIKMSKLFTQDNNLSFTHEGDDFPKQGFMDREYRQKLIHTVGLTADCEFVSNGEHPYTGIFKGAKNGFVRFSAATEPTKDEFIPGFTFKFYRDGVKSANVISMYNLLGQGENSNPFLHDHTNHVPMINVDYAALPQKMLLSAFEKVSKWPTLLGLSDAAKYDQDGNEETDLKFPFRVIFHPTNEARDFISNTLDMKSQKKVPFYVPAMENMEVDTLFEVYVQMTPMSKDVEKIGEIKQKAPFKASDFGDYKMFLEHQFFEDDLAMHPEWEPFVTAIVDEEAATVPNYYRPDLPFNNQEELLK